LTSNKGRSFDSTEEQLRNTIRRCIENVQGLLKGAKILHKDRSTVQYALGLYMYAVEEYGKAHLLKSRGNPSNDTSHNAKLREGFNNLPPECERLTNSMRFHVNTSLSPRVDIVETPTGSTPITVPEHSAGISFYRTHPTRELKFDYKTGCFT
jgi:hypothetical protein